MYTCIKLTFLVQYLRLLRHMSVQLGNCSGPGAQVTGFAQVDIPASRYKPVNFGAETSPSSPSLTNW